MPQRLLEQAQYYLLKDEKLHLKKVFPFILRYILKKILNFAIA